MSRPLHRAMLGSMKRYIPHGLVLLSLVPLFAGLARLFGLATGAATMEGHARFAADPLPAVLHIVGATSFATLGALQFAPALRKTRWHRLMGRALAPAGIVAALAGIWMVWRWPPKPFDGLALNAMRVIVAATMIVWILLSLVAARRRDFAAHGRWMTRAYALGAAAGTQVFTLLPFLVLESLQSVETQAILMGAAWVINAGVAEWSLRRPAPKRGVEMRALRHERYGGPELLRMGHAPLPEPGAGQVRVRVKAASINAMDYRIMRADPFLVRLQCGLFHPRDGKLGADLAGVVDVVGPGVTAFVPGDEVFGEVSVADGLGSFAEAVVVPEQAIVKKPKELGFIEAAALPLASITALQAVRDRARVAPGHRVLIQGAGGGVGTFLVQLAKAYGAHVTAVCGPSSVEVVRALGADVVVDYSREDFAAKPDRFDSVFGVNGFRSLDTYRRQLKAGGVYVMVGGTNRQIFEALFIGKLRFLRSGRRIEVVTVDDRLRVRDLSELQGWFARGRLRVAIDRVFPFAEVLAALRYMEAGHVRGKVVLDMGAALG